MRAIRFFVIFSIACLSHGSAMLQDHHLTQKRQYTQVYIYVILFHLHHADSAIHELTAQLKTSARRRGFELNSPIGSPLSQWGIDYRPRALKQDLILQMHQLEEKGMISIIAKPFIITTNKAKASISMQEKRPSIGMMGKKMIRHVDSSLFKLTILPSIIDKKNAYLDLDISNEQFISSSTNQTTYQHLATRLLCKNHESVLLGGLYALQEKRQKSCVPLISRIPLLGDLFCHDNQFKIKEETWAMVCASWPG